MAGIGDRAHEEHLLQAMAQLKKEGYFVMNLRGNCPDAIACNYGRWIAVDIIGVSQLPELIPPHYSNSAIERKRRHYLYQSEFDSLRTITFAHDELHRPFSEQRIVRRDFRNEKSHIPYHRVGDCNIYEFEKRVSDYELIFSELGSVPVQ